MKNIAFIGNSEGPAKLLDIFRKMTIESKGIWGQLKGVDNYKDAHFYGVIDYLPNDVRNEVDESKCIFLGAHPETMSAFHSQDNYRGFKMCDISKGLGFNEYWINLNYSELKELKPMNKTKQLACIMSDANSQFYHIARRDHLARFVENNASKIEFNLHGRLVPFTNKMKEYYRGACGSYDPRGAASSGGNDHMVGKEQVLFEHKYILEYDATGEFYQSERFFDDLLMWCLPLYFGGNGPKHFLPRESFCNLNINGDGTDIIEWIKEDKYEQSLPFITEARDILLDKMQLWPKLHYEIFGTYK